jgi:hypothetical protein
MNNFEFSKFEKEWRMESTFSRIACLMQILHNFTGIETEPYDKVWYFSEMSHKTTSVIQNNHKLFLIEG